MPFDVGALAAASAGALSVSFGLAALHYRRAMREMQSALRRYVDRDASAVEGDARHRVLLDHSPIGCVVWEPGFHIVEWNRQAEVIFGWRRDEAVGRHLIETLFREEDRAGMARLAEKLFAGAVSQHGALTHIGRDGGTIVCEWHHAAVRDRDGAPVRIVSMCLDVTGVREIERENALFRALVEHTSDPAVLLLDEQDGYRVRYANAAAARHFGHAVADLIGMIPSDWDPHVDATSLARFREAAGKDRTIAIETEHRRADGTLVPVEVTSNAIDHAGHAYVICYVRDISRRRADEARMRALEVEAALREAEKRHREVFEHSSDALFSVDVSPQGDMTLAGINPAAAQAFGMPAQTLLGLGFESIAGGHFGRDSGRSLAEHLHVYRECVQTGLPVEYEGPLDLSPPGMESVPRYAIRLIPLADDAGIERIIGIGRDVTAQRRYEADLRRAAEALGASERMFRSLSENMPDNVARYDADARFLYANPRLLRTLDVAPDALLGMTPAEIMPDQTAVHYVQCILDAARGGREMETEIRYADASGRIQYHHIRIAPERDETGAVVSVLAIGRDITERRQLEDILGFVAQRGWTDRAESSLGALAHHLGKTTGVDYVIISRLADKPGIAETAAIYAKGSMLPSMCYELRGTPCDNVLGKALCLYPENVQSMFPEDALLVDMKAESYVGIPLRDSAGEPIGLIAVLDGKPMKNPDAFSRPLQIVATAAAAELERERADRQLRAREREFRSLAENSPDHIARYTPDGCFAYVNPRMATALGMSAASLLGRTPGESFPDGSFDVIGARIQAAGREGLTSEIEVVIPTALGDLRYHSVVVVPERAADGSITSVLTVSRDVTEQKHAQRHMALLTLALNHMNDGSVLTNRDGRILNANRAFCAMLGYERGELVGRPIFDVSNEFTASNWENHWKGILAKGGADLIETRNRTRDGRPLPVEVSISLFDFEGETYNLAAVRDITERKRMERLLEEREREFRSLAENSPDLIARYDRGGRRLYINGAVTRLCGQPLEALIGATPEDGQVVTAGQMEKLMSAIRHIAATGQGLRDELEIVDRDGVRRIFQGQMVPEFGPDGEVESVLVIGHDITAMRDAERLVGRFVANMPGFAFTLHRSPDGRYGFPFASPGIRKLFGLRPEKVRSDMAPLTGLIHGLDRPQVQHSLEAAAEGFSSLQLEFRITGPDGAECWIEVRGTPERESDGGIFWHGVMLNVTKRKRTEQDLRQREQEFRALAENSPDPIFRYDPQGRRIFANHAAANLSRKTAGELIGKSLSEQLIIPAAVADQVRRVISTVVETGQPQECEIDFIGPVSGVRRVMQNRYVPEFGLYGRVVSVLSISRDITTLKETLETLSHRERSLAEAQRMGRIGSWELDLEENRLDWSDEVYRIFEIDQARFGASYEAFLDAIHPEDRDAVNSAYARSLETREAYSIDHRLLMPDGRVKYVHERCETEYDAQGKPLLSRGTVQDVTERTLAAIALRQREQEFRTLAENSPDIIVRYDRQGRRTYVNQAYLAANRMKKELVLGKTVAETAVFPPALAADFGAMLARVILGARNDELSMTWRRDDGETVSYFLRAVPEFGDDGEVVSVLTVARDVTVLKETERRLVESRGELQELTARREDAREEERRRIARDLHEELGQTLSALRMSISVLPIEYAHAVPELRPRTQAMLKLTDRALHGMRQAVMTLRPTALDAGIAAGLEWLAREFEEHAGIPCVLHLAAEEPDLGDRETTTLFRIAQEALTNAARHARARRADLTLRHEANGWLLEVRDDGRGFDPAVVHEKAFGLRSMSERAQSIDGRIAIQSSPGRGTVVTLRIPQ